MLLFIFTNRKYFLWIMLPILFYVLSQIEHDLGITRQSTNYSKPKVCDNISLDIFRKFTSAFTKKYSAAPTNKTSYFFQWH